MNKSPKIPKIYNCIFCDYNTSNKKDFNKHLLTPKHINKSFLNEIEQENPEKSQIQKFTCEKCNKKYKARNSLWYHEKKCKINNENKEIEIDNNEENEENEENKLIIINNEEQILELKNMMKDLIKHNGELMKQNTELVQTIKEMTPKIGNHTNITNNTTNNNFNLNLFLNEKCKDAINLSDFIATIQFTDDDLKNTRINGAISTLSNLMIKGLKELDITKRPLHCTDVKRETLYIKDNEKWEKDENHEKIMDALGDIAQKQREYLWEWSDANPDSQDVMHPLNDVFHHTNVKVLDPLNKKEELGKKFIRNISKEIFIDKSYHL